MKSINSNELDQILDETEANHKFMSGGEGTNSNDNEFDFGKAISPGHSPRNELEDIVGHENKLAQQYKSVGAAASGYGTNKTVKSMKSLAASSVS